MAVDTSKKQPATNKPAASTPAAATPEIETSDGFADYSSLAEATKTKSGFPVLRSLAGETVLMTDMVQDEATKTYLATLVNADGSERGKYAVPPTYAKKLSAALKARPTNAKGIRVRLSEQKRGIGLS